MTQNKNFKSVSTEEAEATNETFVRAIRSSTTSSITSTTWTNAFDGESKDNRNEFSSSAAFSPDKSGEYEIDASVNISGSGGDQLEIRVQNTTDGVQEGTRHDDSQEGGQSFLEGFWVLQLDSSKSYEIQVRDNTSSFEVGTETEGTIKRSVVQ